MNVRNREVLLHRLKKTEKIVKRFLASWIQMTSQKKYNLRKALIAKEHPELSNAEVIGMAISVLKSKTGTQEDGVAPNNDERDTSSPDQEEKENEKNQSAPDSGATNDVVDTRNTLAVAEHLQPRSMSPRSHARGQRLEPQLKQQRVSPSPSVPDQLQVGSPQNDHGEVQDQERSSRVKIKNPVHAAGVNEVCSLGAEKDADMTDTVAVQNQHVERSALPNSALEAAPKNSAPHQSQSIQMKHAQRGVSLARNRSVDKKEREATKVVQTQHGDRTAATPRNVYADQARERKNIRDLAQAKISGLQSEIKLSKHETESELQSKLESLNTKLEERSVKRIRNGRSARLGKRTKPTSKRGRSFSPARIDQKESVAIAEAIGFVPITQQTRHQKPRFNPTRSPLSNLRVRNAEENGLQQSSPEPELKQEIESTVSRPLSGDKFATTGNTFDDLYSRNESARSNRTSPVLAAKKFTPAEAISSNRRHDSMTNDRSKTVIRGARLQKSRSSVHQAPATTKRSNVNTGFSGKPKIGERLRSSEERVSERKLASGRPNQKRNSKEHARRARLQPIGKTKRRSPGAPPPVKEMSGIPKRHLIETGKLSTNSKSKTNQRRRESGAKASKPNQSTCSRSKNPHQVDEPDFNQRPQSKFSTEKARLRKKRKIKDSIQEDPNRQRSRFESPAQRDEKLTLVPRKEMRRSTNVWNREQSPGSMKSDQRERNSVPRQAGLKKKEHSGSGLQVLCFGMIGAVIVTMLFYASNRISWFNGFM